ncbi:MAG: hypothetical protein GF350_02390 [Chitinivibrionales bacterium]|nr:hypothetical protein [Chitinivibrionales bacterium]
MIQRPYLFIFLALSSLCLQCIPSSHISCTESITVARQSIPDKWADEPVIILGDTVSIEFRPGEDANTVVTRECRWYYVNKRNPAVLQELLFYDYESIEKVPSLDVAAFYPDGDQWTSSSSDIERFRYFHDNVYSSNCRVQRLALPRYEEGMIIRREVRREYTRPEFLTLVQIRQASPAMTRTVSVSIPADCKIKCRFHNRENLAIDTNTIQKEMRTIFMATGTKLEEISEQNQLKNPEDWYAAVHFSFPPSGTRSFSWKEMGDYYHSLVEYASASSPEIDSLAGTIRATDPDSVIIQAFLKVRKRIRYHADLREVHAYIPRTADTILSRGYGDCKEMSSLLRALCARKGVRLNLALVSTLGEMQVRNDIPTLGAFNHVIVYYETGDGTLQFLDPTIRHGNPRWTWFHCAGQKVFCIRPGGSVLTTVPEDDRFVNSITTDNSIYRISPDGSWGMKGTICMKGRAAQLVYPLVNTITAEERFPFFQEYLLEMLKIRLFSLSIEQLSADSIQLAYKAGFGQNYLALDKGGFLLDAPSLYGGDIRFTTLENEGPRYYRKYSQQDCWHLPGGFTDTETVDLQGPVAGGTWKQEGQTIVREYTGNPIVVPPEQREMLIDFAVSKAAFIKGTVWKNQ